MSTPVIDYTGNIIESVRAHLRHVERLQRTLETSDQATRDLLLYGTARTVIHG